MKRLVIVILVAICSCTFGGEIAEIYYKNVRASPEGFLKSRVANNTEVTSTNHGIAEIGIERSGCFGSCPIYAFVVKSDGTFRYKGEKYTERLGEITGTIPVWQFNRLAQFMKDSDYIGLNETYTRGVTDSSTTFTTIVMNGKRKVISDYANSGPTKLWAIEQLIDSLLTKAKWDDVPAKVSKEK